MNPGTFEFISRFLVSLLFSALYLFSGRNLLGPIVAHATLNMLLIFRIFEWVYGLVKMI